MSKTVQPYEPAKGIAELKSDLKAQARSPRGNTSGSGFPTNYMVGSIGPTPPAGFVSLGENVRLTIMNNPTDRLIIAWGYIHYKT